MRKVIIIGSGIGGLATANLLAQDGYEVHVYEKNTTPGGKAGQMEVNGFRFDTGPSWYLMPEVFERYFSLLGESVDDYYKLKKLKPAYKVYFADKTSLVISGDLSKDSETFESIEAGAGAALMEYIAQSDKIYKLATRYFLYTDFRKITNLLRKDVLKNSLTMGKMAVSTIDQHVSRSFQNQKLRQLLEYPAVFLGTSPFKAPAIYSLMSVMDFKNGVFYPLGGMYKIIDALVKIGKKQGVHYHYKSSVKRIVSRNGVVSGIELAGGEKVSADTVVSNADIHYTETKLLSSEDRSYSSSYWDKKEVGPSALLMYLGVKGSIPEFEHHTLLFVDEWKQNFDEIHTQKKIPEKASLYLCKTSQTDTGVAPKGHENIFVLVPLPAGINLGKKALEALADYYLAQIKVMTGVDIATRVVSRTLFTPKDFESTFNSWQGSMLGLSHTLGQSALFRTKNKSKKVEGLYYVGANTLPGIGLPMCLISAEVTSRRIHGDAISEVTKSFWQFRRRK